MEKYARFRYQPCKPLGEDGRCVTASEKHTELSRRAATEGMVLLKNEDNALPLAKGEKIALFGKATIEYIKGGGGSGDVNCPYIHNIYDGFSAKDVSVYMPLVDFYRDYVERESVNIPTQDQINATWDIVNAMEFCTKRDDMTYDTFASMHVKEPAVPDELISSAAEFADTAIITLSRFSAEGVDRRPIPGDYYLSDIEKDLIDKAAELFSKVVIVINSGAVIDCEYFAENDDVQAVLFGWQGGMEGGLAVADIICGDVNPSGKLADTIAKSYDCYPCKDDFWECFDHLDYTDDIYVGYRYFETISPECVRYPFGFGLSYSEFVIGNPMLCENDDKIIAVVEVKNEGNFAGKEVIQLYYSAPQGLLGKPAKELAAFRKTKLLQPGETEMIMLSFDVEDMASFDDLGKVGVSAYVLEEGEYEFYIGTSVRDANKADFIYVVEDSYITDQLDSWCKPFKLKKRMLADGTYEELPTGEEEYYYGENKPTGAVAPEKETKFDLVGEEISMDEFVAQFTLEELMDFVGGQAPTGVANTGCFGGLKRLSVPAVATADGPAGLRLDVETGIPTTAWPCATLLACSWNPDLIYEVGAAGGAEVRENNLGIWLTPAMNIHRDPLCGRNFEYYSEDPLLAGKCAAAATRGIQSQKVAVSVKHFACNNKEANRFGCDSRVSERALREIYLKGFEICVREADPYTIMSSYNLINGQHTSESYELLTEILRNEWRFKGMVTTDWGVKNDPVKEVKAGNDMKMHCGYPEDLKKGIEDGRITRADLELCVKRILTMFTKLA
ncbi:MAG: glycoside hydrolase family 3 C-terminal domain-containing protein [Acutalibacteraceae bacterium]|nr:glycoside hydrolase family 3 C-terminal domain-containing protein [Acutalibacteraceae bacterium]